MPAHLAAPGSRKLDLGVLGSELTETKSATVMGRPLQVSVACDINPREDVRPP